MPGQGATLRLLLPLRGQGGGMTIAVLLWWRTTPMVRAGYGRLLEQAGGIRVQAEADDAEQAYER